MIEPVVPGSQSESTVHDALGDGGRVVDVPADRRGTVPVLVQLVQLVAVTGRVAGDGLRGQRLDRACRNEIRADALRTPTSWAT